jgi:hypothetical protein
MYAAVQGSEDAVLGLPVLPLLQHLPTVPLLPSSFLYMFVVCPPPRPRLLRQDHDGDYYDC